MRSRPGQPSQWCLRRWPDLHAAGLHRVHGVQAAQQACIDLAASSPGRGAALPELESRQEQAAFSLGVPTNPLHASKMLLAWSSAAESGARACGLPVLPSSAGLLGGNVVPPACLCCQSPRSARLHRR